MASNILLHISLVNIFFVIFADNSFFSKGLAKLSFISQAVETGERKMAISKIPLSRYNLFFMAILIKN